MRGNMKKIIFVMCLLAISIFASACATKYICSNGQTVSDASLCPKQVECKYAYDCDASLNLRCLSNHCVSVSDYSASTRSVECNSVTSCAEGYTCRNTFCVKVETTTT